MQRGERRLIGDAVDARGTEVALECGDNFHGGAVIFARDRHAVAIAGKRLLQALDVLADGTWPQRLATYDRRGLNPMADSGIGQLMPWKFLARILLARRCDIRMCQHPLRQDLAAEHNAAAQCDHGGDLA